MAHRQVLINSVEELEARTPGAIVRDREGNVYQLDEWNRSPTRWWAPGNECEFYTSDLPFPVTVLWEPT